jgi:methylated-DNA-protein-cysteine methyltransferase-like protein
MNVGENIFEKVYEIVKNIPVGKVTTYGAIAQAIGIKSSARMVGWALNSDRGNITMPYHRVVNRNGQLTGKNYFHTPNMMRELLESEGISFVNESVDMTKHYWAPFDTNNLDD